MEDKKAIILIGPPGSGKGTQGKFIAEKFNIERYIMSDLLKVEANQNQTLKEKMDKGILIDDETVFNIFTKHFNNENVFLLDGLPRKLYQGKLLEEFLTEKGYDIVILYIHVDDKYLLNRITNRYYCPKCHTFYNTVYMPPKQEGVCDNDGEALKQREDDKPEVFKKRLETFHKENKPILEHFSSNVQEINGAQDIEEVSKEIESLLNRLLGRN